jgi:hypothetical protein
MGITLHNIVANAGSVLVGSGNTQLNFAGDCRKAVRITLPSKAHCLIGLESGETFRTQFPRW